MFKNLKSAHEILGKKKTEDLIVALKDHFIEYHKLYEEKRADWKIIPAEQVAQDIFDGYIPKNGDVNFRIIDFGCGIDGLFEHKLADLVATRDAKGNVYTLAVDVGDVDAGPQSWPKVLTERGSKPRDGGLTSLDDAHTTFKCESLVGDYSSFETYSAKQMPLFDAGVLCLSIMAMDALPRALLVASKTIKPCGTIFVVLDLWKFGVHAYVSLTHVSKA